MMDVSRIGSSAKDTGTTVIQVTLLPPPSDTWKEYSLPCYISLVLCSLSGYPDQGRFVQVSRYLQYSIRASSPDSDSGRLECVNRPLGTLRSPPIVPELYDNGNYRYNSASPCFTTIVV